MRSLNYDELYETLLAVNQRRQAYSVKLEECKKPHLEGLEDLVAIWEDKILMLRHIEFILMKQIEELDDGDDDR